ncbi:MAG: NTP transferase domain-containing protein [Candidatus Thorarchaeota archaeon]
MSLLENNTKGKLSIIILCAGKGIRLKKVTKTLPKPLIKINAASILEHILDCLNNLYVGQIAIVIGYLGDKIRELISRIIKNNEKLENKLVIIDTKEKYQLGPLYSFLSITENTNFFAQNNYYLVMPGDTIFDFEILKDIISIVSNNLNLIQKYPLIFFRKMGLKTLKQYYKRNRVISNARIKTQDSNLILENISQIKVKNILHNQLIHQIIPIFIFPYTFIKNILDIKDETKYNTLWEFLNYTIEAGLEILAFRIDENYKFYDIDYKSDLKKKRKGQ